MSTDRTSKVKSSKRKNTDGGKNIELEKRLLEITLYGKEVNRDKQSKGKKPTRTIVRKENTNEDKTMNVKIS
jgi:hypothetical protein